MKTILIKFFWNFFRKNFLTFRPALIRPHTLENFFSKLNQEDTLLPVLTKLRGLYSIKTVRVVVNVKLQYLRLVCNIYLVSFRPLDEHYNVISLTSYFDSTPFFFFNCFILLISDFSFHSFKYHFRNSLNQSSLCKFTRKHSIDQKLMSLSLSPSIVFRSEFNRLLYLRVTL